MTMKDDKAIKPAIDAAVNMPHSGRRAFLTTTASVAFVLVAAPRSVLADEPKGRELFLSNVHTKEEFKGEYSYDGEYIPEAVEEINKVLRDRETNEVYPIDLDVLDNLYRLKRRAAAWYPRSIQYPFEIYSGYRSPKINTKMCRQNNGVACSSHHTLGQAADISLEKVSAEKLRHLAAGLRRPGPNGLGGKGVGGIGLYRDKKYIHIDIGRKRSWGD